MSHNKNDHFPINDVRTQFPALKRIYNKKPAIYFDGPGGSQVVKSSIDAVTDYMLKGGANLHGQFPTSIETENIISEAREAVADLLAVKASEVAFGANMTTLIFSISRAISRNWKDDEELVVTELDHRANVDPWLEVAKERGMKVRWIRLNPDTCTLDLANLDEIITEKTRLVAIGLASNAIGTINNVARVAAKAREVGALVAVDGVHAVPHIAVDRDQIGADLFFCSTYKFFGPHLGIAVLRTEILDALSPYKVVPAPDYMPDKLETGTQNHEGIAGVKPVIDFIASLGSGSTRREKILSGYKNIEAHENSVVNKIRDEMAQMPEVTLFQAPDDVKKTPTIAFQINGMTPTEVCKYMAEEHSLFVADGHFYAINLADILGVNESGGWVRAGLAPYNTEEEANQFIDALHHLTSGRNTRQIPINIFGGLRKFFNLKN